VERQVHAVFEVGWLWQDTSHLLCAYFTLKDVAKFKFHIKFSVPISSTGGMQQSILGTFPFIWVGWKAISQ
jgi:hypothetical protein